MDPLEAQKRSKRTVTIILVITAILAIASVIIGYYYFQIKDLAPQDSNASQGCGCYFIASTSQMKSCADSTTKNAFEFRTGTIQSDGSCSASCDLRTASDITNTDKSIMSCKVSDFPINPGCTDVSVENGEGIRYANSVLVGTDLTVKAKFTLPTNVSAPTTDDYYTSFAFIINGVKTEISKEQAEINGSGTEREYIVKTNLKNYSDSDSINIQAFGTTATGADVTSIACQRSLAVEKPKAPTCSALNAEIINDTTTKKPKVNEVRITLASVSSPKTISIKFTLGKSGQTLTTKDLSSQYSNNSLVLTKSYLYNATNFIDNKSFSILDSETQNIPISAEVYVDGVKIVSDSCTGSFEIPVISENPSDPTDNTGGNNGGTGNNNGGSTPTDGSGTTNYSMFTVTNTISQVCLERVTPRNAATYTITIKNNDTESESITRVENKLPLGFTYLNGTTYLNGALTPDSGTVTVTTVGSSQQITFANSGGWSVSAGSTLTIRFSATVSTGALTGTNLNEVVVVPVNTPQNENAVRTSVSTTVSQSCSAPETGLFDSVLSKVLAALFIIFTGTFLYFSQSGLIFSEKVLASAPVQGVRKWRMKNKNPKKYFEEKFLEDLDKKSNQK